MTRRCGVYEVRQISTGAAYVGSSTNLESRRLSHWATLRAGVNGSRALQEAWDLTGESDFQFVILEECRPEERLRREQFWLGRAERPLNATGVRRSGRPCLPPDRRRVTVKTRVEPKKIARIALYAATRGISVGQLIDEYVGRQIGERSA